MRANSRHNKNMVTGATFILLATIILVCGRKTRSMGKVDLFIPTVRLKMVSMTTIHFIRNDLKIYFIFIS